LALFGKFIVGNRFENHPIFGYSNGNAVKVRDGRAAVSVRCGRSYITSGRKPAGYYATVQRWSESRRVRNIAPVN